LVFFNHLEEFFYLVISKTYTSQFDKESPYKFMVDNYLSVGVWLGRQSILVVPIWSLLK